MRSWGRCQYDWGRATNLADSPRPIRAPKDTLAGTSSQVSATARNALRSRERRFESCRGHIHKSNRQPNELPGPAVADLDVYGELARWWSITIVVLKEVLLEAERHLS